MNKKLNSNLSKLALILVTYAFISNTYWCRTGYMTDVFGPTIGTKLFKLCQYVLAITIVIFVLCIPVELFEIIDKSSTVPVPAVVPKSRFSLFASTGTDQIAKAQEAAKANAELVDVVMQDWSLSLISFLARQSTMIKVLIGIAIISVYCMFDIFYLYLVKNSLDVTLTREEAAAEEEERRRKRANDLRAD